VVLVTGQADQENGCTGCAGDPRAYLMPKRAAQIPMAAGCGHASTPAERMAACSARLHYRTGLH